MKATRSCRIAAAMYLALSAPVSHAQPREPVLEGQSRQVWAFDVSVRIRAEVTRGPTCSGIVDCDTGKQVFDGAAQWEVRDFKTNAQTCWFQLGGIPRDHREQYED